MCYHKDMSVYPITLADGTVVRDEEHMRQVLNEAGERARADQESRWDNLTESERDAERRAVASRGRKNWSNT